MISRFHAFILKHQKIAPVVFFVMGFIWDSLTLGRVDRLYDRVILSVYLISLSGFLYLFNLADDGKWKNTFLAKYEDYFPLAIQFFLGGLSSAYVIYFSRSVSFTKTLSFFVILVFLLFANELFKKRISNKYLQFSTYFFVNFTFFTFYIPVLVNSMNTFIFIISGLVSITTTLLLITFIYSKSPSTRVEIKKGKLIWIIIGIYAMINTFYFFNLIPPVPLALQEGLVVQNLEKRDNTYILQYQKGGLFSNFDPNIIYKPGDNIYVYTSIFAPADLSKKIVHQWNWKNPKTNKWEVTDEINYEITGGREGGYRGYTFKEKMLPGEWKVDVNTDKGLVLGRINFTIIIDSTRTNTNLVTEVF